ncbi:methyltransferase domain-containing protein [Prauserella muralis]|uniref:Ubiquinone biosynthesis protein n=1 Tax=Prauserella muralis TaxID=588067 RepID=A0A2V4BKT6_9PSEU|nr:methyltransferase domain-containing protein [Prauserella muralis]PXY31233.1 ubiquinone biosynthesis protein [Prauserella muralis]TWE14462.1 methyltransferase family protein [Prauserella muralis]
MLEGYAADAAGFVLPLLRPGNLVLDVGRGEATLTLGTAAHPLRVLGVDADLARAAGARAAARRASVSTVDYLVAAPDLLPLPSSSVDIVYSHALLGELADPGAALTEFARVLRPGGTLAVSAADWSRARLRPKTANVDAALRGRHLLHRRSGGDPFAGRRVAEWVTRAGFYDVRSRTRYREGVGYQELARRVEAQLAAAVQTDEGARDQQLASAARSAWMWARGGSGDFAQCWTELLATR